MKRISRFVSALLAAVITAGSLTLSAFAEKRVDIAPDEEYYEYLLKATRGELTNGQILKFLISDGDINVDIFHTDEVELFRSKTALVSFDCDLSDVPEEYLKSGGYKIYAYFEFYTSASTHYVCEVCLNERKAYTAEELLTAAGVEDSAEITAIRVYQRNFVSKEIKEQLYNEDYIALRCFRRIDNAFVISSKNKGWNTVNLSTKYYVKKDGSLVTKSCKIGGIRYKFTADGICQGRYTGWTKSDKGRRYWKNGELVTEKYIRTKSGKRYYADKDGYVTEV